MILKGYGIELHRLTASDIELVRVHRNSEKIRNSMEYREEITPEMQMKWFRSVDTIHHNYFLVVCDGEKIGLINGSGIDWEKKETANGGIFIWNETFHKTSVPLRASLLLTDVSFYLGFERTFVKILRGNSVAIKYNGELGYELLAGQENVINQKYVLERENYFKRTAALRKALMKEDEKIELTFFDRQDEHSAHYIPLLKNPGSDFTNHVKIIFA